MKRYDLYTNGTACDDVHMAESLIGPYVDWSPELSALVEAAKAYADRKYAHGNQMVLLKAAIEFGAKNP